MTNDAEPQLPAVIAQAAQVVKSSLPAQKADDLLLGMFVLLGLRYNDNTIEHLRGTVMNLRESSVYKITQNESFLEAFRQWIEESGVQRLQPISTAARNSLTNINDLARLKRIFHRIPDANNWDDLLATPQVAG